MKDKYLYQTTAARHLRTFLGAQKWAILDLVDVIENHVNQDGHEEPELMAKIGSIPDSPSGYPRRIVARIAPIPCREATAPGPAVVLSKDFHHRVRLPFPHLPRHPHPTPRRYAPLFVRGRSSAPRTLVRLILVQVSVGEPPFRWGPLLMNGSRRDLNLQAAGAVRVVRGRCPMCSLLPFY